MKILIVEDELIIAEDIKITILSQKHKLTGIASSYQEAINCIEKEKPDVIFMDIGLKGSMNGIQTAKIIYEKYNIRSIYLTSFFQKIPEDAQSTRPYAYLIKPVVQEEIIQSLEKVRSDQNNQVNVQNSTQYLQETFYSKIINY